MPISSSTTPPPRPPPPAPEEDDAWLSEIRRRAERVARGESRSVSWEEAKRRVLEHLRTR